MMTRQELYELLPRDKHDLERVRELAALGYPEVAPILPELLKWMQDYNWPVAKEMAPFLVSIGVPLADEIRRIFLTNDDIWHYWILSCVVADSPELAAALYDDLLRFSEISPANEDQEFAKETAGEILEELRERNTA